MFNTLKNKFGRIKTNLNRVGRDQPLHAFVLVILLFLDLFILVSIFDGLNEHSRQLRSPDEYIPDTCREMVIQGDWNPTKRLDRLSPIIHAYSTSYVQVEVKKERRHPVCGPLLEPIEKIKADPELTKAFEARRNAQTEFKELERKIADLKGAYDTSLLESIARPQGGGPALDSVKKDIREKTVAFNALQNRLTFIDEGINKAEAVRTLWERLESIPEADRDRLKSDLRTMNFWFPLERLGMQLLFLLPLFVVFYYWNTVSLRNNRGVQTLVSSHLLVVSFIPIFFKIVETLYDIIPQKLLKRFIDFLISMNLVAIWHYLIIAVSVAATLLLIYIFQKKVFSRDKQLEKRIAKGLCQHCGKLLPPASKACPYCGSAQFKICGHCHQPTHVHSKYCRECGHPTASEAGPG